MDDELRSKIQELRHLMEHATVDDGDRINEIDAWFASYKSRATPAQQQELRDAVKRLTPVAVKVLMEINSESQDPELIEKSRELLENVGPIRPGGRN